MSTSSGISSVKELSNISMRLNNHLQLTLRILSFGANLSFKLWDHVINNI